MLPGVRQNYSLGMQIDQQARVGLRVEYQPKIESFVTPTELAKTLRYYLPTTVLLDRSDADTQTTSFQTDVDFILTMKVSTTKRYTFRQPAAINECQVANVKSTVATLTLEPRTQIEPGQQPVAPSQSQVIMQSSDDPPHLAASDVQNAVQIEQEVAHRLSHAVSHNSHHSTAAQSMPVTGVVLAADHELADVLTRQATAFIPEVQELNMAQGLSGIQNSSPDSQTNSIDNPFPGTDQPVVTQLSSNELSVSAAQTQGKPQALSQEPPQPRELPKHCSVAPDMDLNSVKLEYVLRTRTGSIVDTGVVRAHAGIFGLRSPQFENVLLQAVEAVGRRYGGQAL